MKYINLILVLFALNISIGFAQTNDGKNPTLQELYGDFTPKQSEQLNPLAHKGLTLPDTKVEEWPGIRAKILKRVKVGLGQGPVELVPAVNKFEELERIIGGDLVLHI